MKWTEERCEQLAMLRRTLAIAGSLNRGNNITTKITDLENACQMLDNEGFIQFLHELAIEERAQHVIPQEPS
jgi:hypothetical protein